MSESSNVDDANVDIRSLISLSLIYINHSLNSLNKLVAIKTNPVDDDSPSVDSTNFAKYSVQFSILRFYLRGTAQLCYITGSCCCT